MPHDLAGKDMRNVLGGVSPTKVIFAVLDLWLCCPYTWL